MLPSIGDPAQRIVLQARAGHASLIALFARELTVGAAPSGPHALGRTARFVVDHRPCPVLLLR